MKNNKRICVCTPYSAAAEPRGPRHARALAELYPDDEIIFFDCAPAGVQRILTPVLGELKNLRWVTHEFPTRKSNLVALLYNKARTILGRTLFLLTGHLSPEFFAPAIVGVTRKLEDLEADVYFAHNIEMLLPASNAAGPKSFLLFDCMEFYSNMGEGQSALFRRGVRHLESSALPKCKLITTSSIEVGEAYCEEYLDLQTLALYNCPPRVENLELSKNQPLRLYWRNSVLGISQRGLGDILDALSGLPKDITLYLQGRQAFDGGDALNREIERRELVDRVFLLPPHGPDEGVLAASAHCVGLCLERSGNRNHELTVSNKIFDYMMAGLAVIASDLPGLRSIISLSGAGVVFEPGSVGSLKEQILALYNDSFRLGELRHRARSFALQTGCREVQMDVFKKRVKSLL